MALFNFQVSDPNPSIGNGFDTEAVVQNTLNTSIKGALNGLYSYLITTGLENDALAPQAVISDQILLQSQVVNMDNTDTPLSVSTTYVSSSYGGTISMSHAFANAVTEFTWSYSGYNPNTTKAKMTGIKMQRATNSGFTTGLTDIGNGVSPDSNMHIPPNGGSGVFEFTSVFCFTDDTVKSASTTYYYRFTFVVDDASLNIKHRGSSVRSRTYNGIYN